MSPVTIDVVLGVILLFFSFKGLSTGLIRSLVSLGAVLAAWFVSSTMPLLAAPLAQVFVPPANPAFLLVNRLVVWLAVFLIVQIIGWMVTQMVEGLGLGLLNKLAGLVLGVATGVLIGCVPILVINSVPQLYHWKPAQQTIQQSFFLRTYAPLAAQIVPPPNKH